MVVDSTIRFNDRMDGPSVSLGSKLSNAKVSFAIFKRDIKRLLVNPVALVVTLGVCVIPSLYAWYNIVANWDPYGNTQGIKIAIANNDRGTQNDWVGELNAGDKVVDQLKENHQLGWTFVDSTADAKEGVESGEYYAAIVIPKNFSDNLVSMLDGNYHQPKLTYYVNEKKSAIAPKVTDTGANTIEEQIVPKYYDRDKDGVPHAWVESVKKCVADIASNFTTNRMLNDYEERFYNKLAARKHRIVEGGYKLAREIAAWKRKVSSVWDQIRVIDVQRVKIDNKAIFVGEKYHFEVTVDIVSLRPEDIGVEMVIAQQIVGGQNANVMRTIGLKHTKTEGSRVTYALDYTPDEAGTFDVALRIFPENPHLPHRMDFALVKWA